MKLLATLAGLLLGSMFVFFGLQYLLGQTAEPPPLPEGTPLASFQSAFGPTGYFRFVKAFEVLGGLLVLLPRTRNLGLLVLGPILVNIVAFHFLIAGDGLTDPITIGLCVLALFLLWTERRAWAALVRRER